MLGLSTLALGFLALTSASAVEKRQTVGQGGPGYFFTVGFPAFVGNTTAAGSSVSGSFTFTGAQGGGVQCTYTLSGLASKRKRQTLAIGFTLNSGVASAGCAAVGAVISGGNLSGLAGLITTSPASGSFFDASISVIPGTVSYIGGTVLVITSAGVVVACANLPAAPTPPAATPTPSSVVNVNVNTNVNVNVNVTVNIGIVINTGAIALITTYYSPIFVSSATTIYFFGILYYVTAPGYIIIAVPLTVAPGSTTIISVINGAFAAVTGTVVTASVRTATAAVATVTAATVTVTATGVAISSVSAAAGAAGAAAGGAAAGSGAAAAATTARTIQVATAGASKQQVLAGLSLVAGLFAAVL